MKRERAGEIKKTIAARWYWGATALIWLAGLALRAVRLTQIPAGIHVDEAGMAYDAWCLLTYGTDRFLNRWPVYLINYGSGQSALYAYLCMLCLKLGGVTLRMIRLPALLSGCVVMICGTLLLYRCFAQKEPQGQTAGAAAVLGALVLALCPYFIMASRMGFDCNLMLGASTALLLVLARALREDGSGKAEAGWFAGAGVLIGLTLYTYSLSWLVLPMFLLLACAYLFRCRRLTIRRMLWMGVPAFLLAVPLLLFVAVNRLALEPMRFLWMTIPRIPYFRADHFSLSHVADNLLLLRTLLTTDQYTFNAVKPYGTMYVWSIPLVLGGIAVAAGDLAVSVRRRRYWSGCLVELWFLAQMLCGLIVQEPDIYRMNGIYFSLAFLAVRAAVFLGSGLRKVCAGSGAACVPLLAAAAGYVCFGVSFGHYYFTQYSEDYPIHWYLNDYVDEIMEVFRDADPEQEIYFDNYNCTLYAYDCLIRRVSPYDWNRENTAFTAEENLGHRHYFLPPPEEIRDDAWYVVMDQSGYGWNLEERGFLWNTYGYYKVYYKPQP